MFFKKKKEKEEKEFERMLNDVEASLNDEFINILRKAQDEPFKIEIKREKDHTSMAIEGGRLTLLVNVAGALKLLQEKLNCSDEEFELIKDSIGRVEGEAFNSKEEFDKAIEKLEKPKRERKPKKEVK